MKQFRWLTALVVGAFLLAACGGLQQSEIDAGVEAAAGPADISASVTTVPEDSVVLDYGMVPLRANSTTIKGCEYVVKVNQQVPPDATLTIVAPAPLTGTITFTISGTVAEGYTIEVSDTIPGFKAQIEEAYFGIGNNARKFTFTPGVTYASPLPAPINPSGGAGAISHTFFCYSVVELFEDLDVEKDAFGSYVTEITWELDKYVWKTVDYDAFVAADEDPDLFKGVKVLDFEGEPGDEFDVVWTIEIVKTETKKDFQVNGKITITNPNDVGVDVEVTDKLSDGTVVDVTCPMVNDVITVPANDSIECTYTVELTDDQVFGEEPVEYNDVFVVSLTEGVEGNEARALFGEFFAEEDPFFTERDRVGADEGDLTDLLKLYIDDVFKKDFDVIAPPGQKITGSTGILNISATYECSADAADYTNGELSYSYFNTADLNDEIDRQSSATVNIDCTLAPLRPEKNAKAEYTRTVTWKLDKYVWNAAEYDAFVAETGPFAGKKLLDFNGVLGDTWDVVWTIDAVKTVVESDWKVSGTITIFNDASIAQMITKIEDRLSDGTVAVVKCDDGFVVPARVGEQAGKLECTYEASPNGRTATSNTVEVTAAGNPMQSYTFPEEGNLTWVETLVGHDSGRFYDKFVASLNGIADDPVKLFDNEISDSDSVVVPATYGCELESDFVGGYVRYDYLNTAYLNTFIGLSSFAEVAVRCADVWYGETAWAANDDEPGQLPYNPGDTGNWATYVKYQGRHAPFTTTFFAGQTLEAGKVSFSAPDDGSVTITITLNSGWRFEDNSIVAVQDYADAPTGNPAPGQFDWKFPAGAAGSITVVVPLNNFYGVHADVERNFIP